MPLNIPTPPPTRIQGAFTITGALTTGAQNLTADGTKAAPSYSWTNATNTGWYRRTAGVFSFSLGGNILIDLQTDQIMVPVNAVLGWSSGAPDAAGIDTAIQRRAAAIVAISNAVELPKIAAPAAPAANRGRIFMQDSGGGKVQFAAIFPSGAVQVIATEP